MTDTLLDDAVILVFKPFSLAAVDHERGRFGRVTRHLLDRIGPLAAWHRHRDEFIAFHANPRSRDAMLSLADTELARRLPQHSRQITVTIGEDAPEGGIRVEDDQSFATLLAGTRPRTIVLLFPDALGLGWNTLERVVLSQPAPVWVLNGRRRLFFLDPVARGSLCWRRWLARTRLVELILAAGIVPLAAALALRDRLARRPQEPRP